MISTNTIKKIFNYLVKTKTGILTLLETNVTTTFLFFNHARVCVYTCKSVCYLIIT